MDYTERYLARIVIEAATPMAVSSGETGLDVDRIVAKDANGLPYIPGTGLTGVLRHSFKDEDWVNDIFGSGGNNGKGSRLIVSSAFLIGEDGKTVMDGLRNIEPNSSYYSYFTRLPERDHVKINDKGTAVNHGKFDEELVHKGTRFAFELELIANDNDGENWEKLIQAISAPTYRIGAGTRNGFGKLKIIKTASQEVHWNLKEKSHLLNYLKKSGSLNDSIEGADTLAIEKDKDGLKGWKKYSLQLKARDFFTFSSGFGDEQADNTPKKEKYFEWSTGMPKLTQKAFTLIPATSIKGALAHRVAFHYNAADGQLIRNSGQVNLETKLGFDAIQKRLKQNYLGNLPETSDSDRWDKLQKEIEDLSHDSLKEWEAFKDELDEEVDKKGKRSKPVGENNEAVRHLFGFAKNSDDKEEGLRGSVLIDDVYLPANKTKEKVFNHTRIDRFTNGTMDGALFQEKVSHYDDIISLEIWVEQSAWVDNDKVKEAFEKTLEDLKSGRLALGGSTTKGHGIFIEA